MLLTTTRRINEKEENVLCYFNNNLVIEFTHYIEGNMHTFKRVKFQNLYQYPLCLAEHNALIEMHFAKAYHGADPRDVYACMARDYNRLLNAVYV